MRCRFPAVGTATGNQGAAVGQTGVGVTYCCFRHICYSVSSAHRTNLNSVTWTRARGETDSPAQFMADDEQIETGRLDGVQPVWADGLIRRRFAQIYALQRSIKRLLPEQISWLSNGADPDDTITCCWAAWRRAFWGGCRLPADSWLVCRGEQQVKGTTKGERQVRNLSERWVFWENGI